MAIPYVHLDHGVAAAGLVVDQHPRRDLEDLEAAGDRRLLGLQLLQRLEAAGQRLLDRGGEARQLARLIEGAAVGIFHIEGVRSDEHTSELQSLMRISYAVFCLKKKNQTTINRTTQ